MVLSVSPVECNGTQQVTPVHGVLLVVLGVCGFRRVVNKSYWLISLLFFGGCLADSRAMSFSATMPANHFRNAETAVSLTPGSFDTHALLTGCDRLPIDYLPW